MRVHLPPTPSCRAGLDTCLDVFGFLGSLGHILVGNSFRCMVCVGKCGGQRGFLTQHHPTKPVQMSPHRFPSPTKMFALCLAAQQRRPSSQLQLGKASKPTTAQGPVMPLSHEVSKSRLHHGEGMHVGALERTAQKSARWCRR